MLRAKFIWEKKTVTAAKNAQLDTYWSVTPATYQAALDAAVAQVTLPIQTAPQDVNLVRSLALTVSIKQLKHQEQEDLVKTHPCSYSETKALRYQEAMEKKKW